MSGLELGEVESALLGHAGVSQAVVVARQEETGEKLGWWDMWWGRLSLDVVQMREHLKSKLPIYMVPGAAGAVGADAAQRQWED